MTNNKQTDHPNRNFIELAEGHLERARQELESARNDLEQYRYAKSVHSSQTCMELSMKAIYRFFDEEFTPSHQLKSDEFARVIDLIPENLQYHNYPRLFVLANFWVEFYTISKYGHEKIGISSEKIFKRDEAQLALQHADACNRAANAIQSWHELGRKE